MQTTSLNSQIVFHRNADFVRAAESWRKARPATGRRQRVAMRLGGQYFGHGRQGERRELHRARA